MHQSRPFPYATRTDLNAQLQRYAEDLQTLLKIHQDLEADYKALRDSDKHENTQRASSHHPNGPQQETKQSNVPVHPETVADTLHVEDLLTNISHELRTPLNGIRPVIHLLADECNKTAPQCPNVALQKELLPILKTSQGRLLRVIDDLVLLLHIYMNTGFTKPSRLHLGEILHSCIDQRGMSHAFSVTYSQPKRAPLWVAADRTQLQAVLDRLLIATYPHADTGASWILSQPSREDEVQASLQLPKWRLSPDQRARFFHFKTLEEMEFTQNLSGFSMALAFTSARFMKGNIELRESPDGGTQLLLSLPSTSQP